MTSVWNMTEGATGVRGLTDVTSPHLLDLLPAAAYTCDAAGLITYFNAPAVELWGREPRLNDPVDRYCGSFRLFTPDGTPVPHEDCWMALAIRDGRGYNAHEIVIERQDGSRRTVLAHANPLHDAAGGVVGAVNVLVDITDRKRAELALREADRAKNEFLAVLAHELRNPLAPIHNALEVMRAADDDAGRREQARAVLERQLAHLTRVVDDLLELARITRNALELRRESIEIAAVLDQAVETCRPLIDAAGHRLVVKQPTEPLALDADPQRLAQVFANLLSNACKYTDAGGEITLAVERRGSDLVVSVRDTGVGLTSDEASRIFDMFTRADAAVQRAQEGLGIGLTLARRVVELHGGSIEAHSDGPGTGTEMRVHLPLLRASTPRRRRSDGTRRRTAVRAVAPRRILVVDDNRDSAETLAEFLALDGHETHIARDGATAVQLAGELRPDVMLLDIGLPGLDGYEVARRIRAQPGGDRILLVALTGWGQQEDRRRSAEAGFDDHFVKPADLERLTEVVGRSRRQSVTRATEV